MNKNLIPKPWLIVVTRRNPTKILSGDTRRALEWVSALKENYHVVIVCFDEFSEERLTDFGAVYSVKFSRFRFLINAFIALLLGKPLDTEVFKQKQLVGTVERVIQKFSIQMGLIHLVRFGEVGLMFKHNVRWIFEATDSIALNYARTAKRSGFIGRLFWGYQAKLLLEAERKLIQEFPVTSFISHVDRKFVQSGFGRVVGGNTKIIPNPFLTKTIETRSPKREGNRCVLLFIGRLAYRPNREALKFIVDKLIPELFALGLEITLRVIGSDCPTGFRNDLKRKSFIDFRESVPDLVRAMRGCDVGLCPIFSGAGLQNKLLDYVAAGIPAIATKRAALPFFMLLPSLRQQIFIPTPDSSSSAFVQEILRAVRENIPQIDRDLFEQVFSSTAVHKQMRDTAEELRCICSC